MQDPELIDTLGMDDQSQAPLSVAWSDLTLFKLQWLYRWSLVMDK